MTPPTIERKDRERVITVSAVAGKGAALSDLVAAARNELKQMDIPSDVSCSWVEHSKISRIHLPIWAS